MRTIDKKAMEELRQIMFPAIGADLTTGYNIYLEPSENLSDYDCMISYMHMLTENSIHYKAMKEEFKRELVDEVECSHKAVIRRRADYILDNATWMLGRKMKYYDVNCKGLSERDARRLLERGGKIIGEAVQRELRFCIDMDRFPSFIRRFEKFAETGRGCWQVPINRTVSL